MSLSDFGLVLFVWIHLSTGLALLIDWVLERRGTPTITETVWNRPMLGVLILSYLVLGLVGLALHFYAR